MCGELNDAVTFKPATFVEADLSDTDLNLANLTKARLDGTNLKRAQLGRAKLIEAHAPFANLTDTDLIRADLTRANLSKANLSRANLGAAKLIGANLTQCDFTEADLNDAEVTGADLKHANLSQANVEGLKFDRARMRHGYRGIRGLDSCYGHALFRRAAADQDFLDTLELQWRGSWRILLFRAWGLIDYGRSLSRIVLIAVVIAALYGVIYKLWPALLNFQNGNTGFTPFYFSIVIYTTLGFGDVSPKTLVGELIVSSEVIMGYTTLGLLVSVLAEKLARRS